MKLKIKEIESLGEDSLKTRLSELKQELVKLNAQVATGTTPKNPMQIKNIRKNIARIKTMQNKKKIEELLQKAKKESKKA